MTDETVQGAGAKAVIYRDAPGWDGRRTAAVGKFRCDDAAAGADLLMGVVETLRREGFDAVIGPMDGDTWHSYRLVTETDGSAPFLMEPTSGKADLAAFQAAGFEVIEHYFSAHAPLKTALGHPPDPDPAIEIVPWDGNDPEAHFSAVYDLSVEAFAGNAFYTPISREAFLAMYMPFVPLLKRELILLARGRENGALLGFLFGISNYAQGGAPDTVILKTYASRRAGVGHRLAHAFHAAALDMGFETVIHALIHDANLSAERSAQHGATVFRRYGLMGRVLSG
ncbi:MAG: hypothetical protein HKO95_14250 [Rhodobacteraceae bacterium]|nr:hypothetical protein [Alphaproteobacteria bacterium]NNF73102.1 hypothetical protein [Paracoccaceae bacterium]NNK67885.1 hypothetical protein [Paracoccaceae bacterium]